MQLAPWTAGQPIAPVLFARRPMSRVLVSRAQVPVWLYDGIHILAPGSGNTSSRDFSQIDSETWGRSFAQAVDRILAPPYAAAAMVVDERAKTSHLQRLRAIRTRAAGALANLVVPVFKDVPVQAGARDARETMRERFLQQLSSAFAADVLVQFALEPEPPVERPPAPEVLSFVVTARLPDGETAAAHGSIDVPVIVRAYPAHPQLDQQLGEHKQGTQPDLRSVREWDYRALLSRDSHPPHDRLQVCISFNHPAPVSPSHLHSPADTHLEPTAPDSFSALAAFTAAWPDIAQVLDKSLLPIEPDAPDEAIQKASLALGSFVALADYVAQGLVDDFGTGPPQELALHADAGYAFDLVEGDVPVDVYVLVVDALPPAGIDKPWVDLPGFDTLPCTGEEPWTPPLYQQQIRRGDAFAFAYKATGSAADAPLLALADGRRIRGRSIVLTGLDVLAQQDVLMAVSVSRNRDLVPGMTTAAAFVYATPPVTFAAPMRPLVTDSRLLRIDQLAAGGSVTVASLRTHLQALWDGLFSGAPSRNTMQCRVSYMDDMGRAAPVVMLPPTTFTSPPALPRDDECTASALIDSVDAAVAGWLTNTMPHGINGLLVFDLVVMAAAGDVPLLELSKLTLPIASVSPPLQTS